MSTREISSAVGKMWKTIAVSKKLMPFVPRSMARVKPPVWRERWKLRSRRSRCSYTLQATLRIAFWATLAKTALRSSCETVAPIRVIPSASHSQSKKMMNGGGNEYKHIVAGSKLTSNNHRARYRRRRAPNSGKVYVHGIYNALEVEGNLHVEQLCAHEQSHTQPHSEARSQVILGP
ncbi:hypothetical protein GMOD_00006198 [Pyrenophora seminiperda CCB06]|uniref:Uncharacterized protein n=1 Tax=Pyrenophora seminiperda CCB06 TaxID=1302712 RepID=A0A3M7M4S7_9PLEO|nr:hypothetical protein GMOD_00006198 [Pyrenophora seminiperda CCB06]